MSLISIDFVNAEKIIKEVPTEGNAPLLVLGEDGALYYAKTTSPRHPCVELVNELICGYFAQCWGLKIPKFCLVTIDDSVVDRYRKEGGNLSSRYRADSFSERLYFGSQAISPTIEVEAYIQGFDRRSDLNYFRKPLDFLKIGVFDLWVGNKDRKPDNPNVLIGNSAGIFEFHPIDHAASFAYITNYSDVRDVMLHIDPQKCILSTPLVQSIANFAPSGAVSALKDEILQGMNEVCANISFIFNQVPSNWGLSKRAKSHLATFFADGHRNEKVASSYLSYLKAK